jgi:type I restriction enzyme R subunit
LPAEHGLQQGKGYRVGKLHHVPFVFSTNGSLFVEYDEETGATSDPKPMSEFPGPDELVNRYMTARGLQPTAPVMQMLRTGYKQGRDHLRYYQDAAVRAALEKTIRQFIAKELPRVLLSLGTGAGKTRIAAALLRRLFDAGFLGRGLSYAAARNCATTALPTFKQHSGMTPRKWTRPTHRKTRES